MNAVALYIHWPFCLAKCPYCDFNSHVRETVPERRFAAALRTELAHEAARLNQGGTKRRLGSIFFGGGTPSLMQPDSVADLIAQATSLFDPAPDLEITLEANPTSVEAARLRGFRDAGVNRVSLGVQALDDDALRRLGRSHSAAQAIAALELARSLFARISFDLIYARPEQDLTAWSRELELALALVSDHLSLYQLTIEPGTRYEALHRQGLIVLPDDDDAAALYEATATIATAHGLEAYEVSNYAPARGTKPAQSRLLALPGLCRDRPRRAWPTDPRRRAACHQAASRSGALGGAGRAGRIGRDQLHAALWAGARPRDAADGPPPVGRRPGSRLCGAYRFKPARVARPDHS